MPGPIGGDEEFRPSLAAKPVDYHVGREMFENSHRHADVFCERWQLDGALLDKVGQPRIENCIEIMEFHGVDL